MSWIHRSICKSSTTILTVALPRTKIQILLYLLKLSLPGPCPPSTQHDGAKDPEASSSPKRRKKSKKKDTEPPPESTEERLESFMDKLSMWQLTATIDAWASGVSSNGGGGMKGDGSSVPGAKPKNAKDERDWTQVFCEDNVEPLQV